MQSEALFPLPLPDDPRKWDGWTKYKSLNLYERLCLDPADNPSDELIEEHCRELLRWWQKKLPLKNQPSNPLAQMLRPGLDESSHYITQARVTLLDPERRSQIDEELASQAHDRAVAEFSKYLSFAVADGVLTAEEEKNLRRFGAEQGLPEQEVGELVETKISEDGIQRIEVAPVQPTVASNGSAHPQSSNPREEFLRMLRLSRLDSVDMSDDARDTFINMAETLGLEADDAEDLVDLYLDEMDDARDASTAPAAKASVVSTPADPVPQAPAAAAVETAAHARPAARLQSFVSSVGTEMLLVPSGMFTMGSDAFEAAPDERPLTRVKLSRFYISRFPITNGEYEQFDPTHVRKRAIGASERHPVVYVSSLEAMKFCQFVSAREKKKYRLPTEAEWEYAARGSDNRRYPWGNHGGRGDLANFADKSTAFAWSDREIDDGYAESSPVGAFPFGASPFGMHDMAGNVWEWCLDYYETYRGSPRVDPRGPTAGTKRVYRGGSWKSRFTSLRATARASNTPTYACNDLGFRIVCECD